jgi:hypothetical protein
MAGDLTGNFINNLQNSNAAGGGAKYLALVLGTGDPFMTFEVSGVTTWSHGLDNSDADSYKISQASSLGANDRLTILTGGDTGIGVTTPNRKLSVNGSIGFAETNGNSVWHMTSVSGELLFTKSGSFDAWSMTSAGAFKPGADATYDLGSTSARIRSASFSTSVIVGTFPTGALQVPNLGAYGGSWALIGGDTVTDASSKRLRIGATHYTNAEEPFTLLDATSGPSANTLNIGGGTGSGNAATEVSVWTAANNTTVTGTQRWLWSAAGHYLAIADNTYDIGALAANRPRHGYFAGNLNVVGQLRPTNILLGSVVSAVTFAATTDGILTLSDVAGTSFIGIKFGLGTVAFPYLKVNGANFQSRLANDSDFNRFQAKLQTHANAVAETPTATHTLTLYDAAGTAYRVLCVV